MSGMVSNHPFVADHEGSFVPRGVPASSPRGFPATPALRPKLPWPARVGGWMQGAYRRYRSRQLLAQLDGHLLKDIGVSYAEAEAEANKPFWRG